MAGIFKWVFEGLSQSYGKILARRVRNYGLNYDDLLIEAGDFQTGLARVSAPLRIMRERRIKRAFDITGKKKTVPEEYHNYNPFEFYLQPKIDIAKLERQERILLR